MYIAASRHDEVIPFEGVEKYVDKLQTCIKQHKDYANHQMNTSNAHFWTKVGECWVLSAYCIYNMLYHNCRRQQLIEEQYYLILIVVMDITMAVTKKNIGRYTYNV